MPLKYLIDENLRGKFTLALAAKAAREGIPLNIIETGDEGGPPLGTSDGHLLRWAQTLDRVLVSLDKNTVPPALAHHLLAGLNSPGILLIRQAANWDDILYYLVLYSQVAASAECANQCIYIP